MTTKTMEEPPEGVVSGESVPLENEAEEFERIRIEKMMAQLKIWGAPFTTMSESELEERAVERLERLGGGV